MLCVLALACFARAQQTQSVPQDDAAARVAWHKSMKQTPLPKHGCFTVSYPNTAWQESSCTTAPNIPFVPKSGPLPQTVGGGNDFAAEATSGLISSAEGSFPNAGGMTGESGYVKNQPPAYSNSFSLQLNSEYFYNTPLCASAATPSQCQGWQQFLFTEGNGGIGYVYIQYWLLNYGDNCPSNWTLDIVAYEPNCYLNSTSVNVPAQQAVDLPFMTLTGEASASTDTVIFTAPGDNLSAVGQDSVLNLDQQWTQAEFNVVGDASGGEANFNSGSTLVVQTSLNNGTTNAPQCLGAQGAGTTGETNNLNLIPQSLPVCCPYGGTSPSIQFLESNASGATATCGANGLENNMATAPYSTNGSETRILYPIILGEIRVEYSAKLENNTPGATIAYQLFDACGDSLGGATVSSGTTISYLDTEINGEPCTYGIRGTMDATAPGYVPGLSSGIAF